MENFDSSVVLDRLDRDYRKTRRYLKDVLNSDLQGESEVLLRWLLADKDRPWDVFFFQRSFAEQFSDANGIVRAHAFLSYLSENPGSIHYVKPKGQSPKVVLVDRNGSEVSAFYDAHGHEQSFEDIYEEFVASVDLGGMVRDSFEIDCLLEDVGEFITAWEAHEKEREEVFNSPGF